LDLLHEAFSFSLSSSSPPSQSPTLSCPLPPLWVTEQLPLEKFNHLELFPKEQLHVSSSTHPLTTRTTSCSMLISPRQAGHLFFDVSSSIGMCQGLRVWFKMWLLIVVVGNQIAIKVISSICHVKYMRMVTWLMSHLF
jgi:hypothetical protein